MAGKTDSDGFQVVTRKQRKKPRPQHKSRTDKISTQKRNSEEASCDASNIISRICEYRDEIRASSFYSSLKELFIGYDQGGDKEEAELNEIVCYGVGCISKCPIARYQFALLLLLKDDFQVSSDHCWVYEPLFSKDDANIVQNFDCSMIRVNEEGKRKAIGKSLFIMLHCGKPLYNNVLWANWGQDLKDVLILGNSFSSYDDRAVGKQLSKQATYIAKVLPYIKEIPVKNNFRHNDIFNNTSLHSFPHDKLMKAPEGLWADCVEPQYDDEAEIIRSR
ncbi:SRR1-like protein isoform X1 [Nematostella vectensis]|uniref:SRR1-like protein isoform X1 n=1 Tax=Nematostella vectensis TaxID=45351 RepID=UPI00207729AD|nr:SRR1-like protein isoform X1 [Nematostella vectensis]